MRGRLQAALHDLRLRSSHALRAVPRGALCVLWCVVIYTDAFPVNAPHQQLYQEVKVELCELANRFDVVVSTRLYRDVATVRGLEQVEVSPWRERARRARPDSVTP